MSFGIIASAHVPPAGGPWTPASLGANLVAWWSALDSADYTLSGSNVTDIDDKSGNGHGLTVDTGSGATIGAINSNDAFQLSLLGGYVTVGNVTLTQPFTIASVIRIDSDATAQSSIMDGGGWQHAVRDNLDWRFSAGANRNIGSYVVSTPYAHVASFDSGTAVLRLDGAAAGSSGGVGTAGSTGLLYVGINDSGLEAADITFVEMMVIDGTPSGSDLSNLETYLRGLSGT